MSKYVQISLDGELYSDGNRLDDKEFCRTFIKSLRLENHVCKGYHKGEPIFVEAKSHPMVVQAVEKKDSKTIKLFFNYSVQEDFEVKKEAPLFLDDWSRLCGRSKMGVPFIFSRKAQAHFLSDIVNPIDAETFEYSGESFTLEDWYQVDESTDKKSFWSERYIESHTPWDLNTYHPAIDWVIPRLKLSRSKILVPGCGRGHDVKKLTDLGHQVTGLDFSPQAVEEARGLYPNANFECGDLFTQAFRSEFDAIFEHTLFCALNPAKRSQIIKSWLRLLDDDACLIGVFNVSCKQTGPPFGMTEWELEELLSPYFIINFWGRLRDKESPRPGKELFVHAQKRKGL